MLISARKMVNVNVTSAFAYSLKRGCQTKLKSFVLIIIFFLI